MPTKTLYLLRHAEASQAESGISDYDRSLTPHGEDQAIEVANYIRNKIINFDFVMCSSALRTQQTLEPIRDYLTTAELDINPQYYNINEEQILEYIQMTPDSVQTLLYIGHNPGIAFSALRIIPQDGSHGFIEKGYPPAGLAGFTLGINSWKDANWGCGQLLEFYNPDA